MIFFHEQFDPVCEIRIWAYTYKSDKLPNWQYPPHWHSEHEIIAVSAGSFNVGFNMQTYFLFEGDLIFIPGGNIHYFEAETDVEWTCLKFSPMILKEELNGFSFPVLIKNNKNIDLYFKAFKSIKYEIETCDTAYIDYIGAYMKTISAWFMRNRTEDSIINSKFTDSSNLGKLRDLLDFAANNYSQKITVKTGSDRLHLSERYFTKYFKMFCGATFAQYINVIRIDAAKNMLKTTGKKIFEIAENCGYENIRTFNREFKTLTGMTAKEYRISNS